MTPRKKVTHLAMLLQRAGIRSRSDEDKGLYRNSRVTRFVRHAFHMLSQRKLIYKRGNGVRWEWYDDDSEHHELEIALCVVNKCRDMGVEDMAAKRKKIEFTAKELDQLISTVVRSS